MRRAVRIVESLWLCMLVACGGEHFDARRVTLVSRSREVDRELATARRDALDGELDAADDRLQRLLRNHPSDPVDPVAEVWRARIALARGDVPGAEQLVRALPVRADPIIARSARMLDGVLATRRGDFAAALPPLRALDGQLPDRAETAELSCALADAELHAGDPAQALASLALVDSLARESVPWLSTTAQDCKAADVRAGLLTEILTHAESPQALAHALDGLQTDSPLRQPIALRLRALAQQRHTLTQWLPWLGDLPDDGGGETAVAAARAPRLVIGVLGPLSGARSVVGASILRAVQYGLEEVDDVRSLPDDEGTTPSEAVAALNRLADAGARAVVGVSREDLAAAVAIRSQALGIDLWILAPTQGVAASGGHVHDAGPNGDERVHALVTQMLERHPARVTVAQPPTLMEIQAQLLQALGTTGVAVRRYTIDDDSPRLADLGSDAILSGTIGTEARDAVWRASLHGRGSWVLEARTVRAGTVGTWVGVQSGPSFPHVLGTYCERVGEPPDEIALLAFDAVRNAVALMRGQPQGAWALAAHHPIVVGSVDSGGHPRGELPAAASRCVHEASERPGR